MGIPRDPKPAKYFVALLSSGPESLNRAENDLVTVLGAIDSRSETLPWAVSSFYEKEMGPNLLRRFVSFEPLLSPEKLAEVKLTTQQVEEKNRGTLTQPSGRRVNLDPGYIEAGKLVLASTKNASQRIYLRSGIYAEATLLYYEGGFHGCSYTYPDYLWPETLAFLTRLRAIYLQQLRECG
ncbi:MAG: DUF4416 family protein [Alphaproteobacteria bacterium]